MLYDFIHKQLSFFSCAKDMSHGKYCIETNSLQWKKVKDGASL